METPQPRGLDTKLKDLKAEYERWLETVPKGEEPPSYEWWLEILVIGLRDIIRFHNIDTSELEIK